MIAIFEIDINCFQLDLLERYYSLSIIFDNGFFRLLIILSISVDLYILLIKIEKRNENYLDLLFLIIKKFKNECNFSFIFKFY